MVELGKEPMHILQHTPLVDSEKGYCWIAVGENEASQIVFLYALSPTISSSSSSNHMNVEAQTGNKISLKIYISWK